MGCYIFAQKFANIPIQTKSSRLKSMYINIFYFITTPKFQSKEILPLIQFILTSNSKLKLMHKIK